MSRPAKLDETRRSALGRHLGEVLEGEVRFDNTTRAAYASDSSNYRHVPLGVVYPRGHEDVAAASRVAAEAGAALLARGGGTSLAGQACNEAVVLDMSRHMDRVLEIDSERRTARVQPGVVLDDLRRQAERSGLTFGPDPATHAWCTIGGMVGNNSCGTHGVYAGKTAENVEALTVVLADGETFEARCYDQPGLAAALEGGGRSAAVLSGLEALTRRYGEQVRQRFPDIPRRVSGFNLDQLATPEGMNVARALVGTESTCAFTTEALLRLVTSPAHRALVAIGYEDIYLAAEAVPELLVHPLLALEGFDRTLVSQMQAHGLNQAGVALLPPGDGWLLAELGGQTAEEAREKAARLLRSLPSGTSATLVEDAGQQRLLWAVRESGLGATAIRLDGHHNYEGWEDGAVPPARLAEYLRGVGGLWQRYGYSGAWYGHFGQGCVHTRNNFDLASREGLARYRAYVTEAAELVVSLGGSLSGEHGDGQSRGELLEVMYGPELVGAFAEFKRTWDPQGLMNPGKVVDPYPLDSNIKYFGLSEKPVFRRARYALAADEGSLLHATLRCVGVGRCRRDDTATMCPSFRVTRDEVHSTRGRAKVMAEMFRGELVPATWRNEEVREALELCLSCKACASDCPTHVDMATYKSEFLSHYYQGRLRPAVMYAMGLLPWAARLTSASPVLARLANASLASDRLGPVLKKAAGIAQNRPAPKFSPSGGMRYQLRRSSPDLARHKGASVVVWPDTFTDAFSPQVGREVVSMFELLGERVAVPQGWATCGRTLYDFGMLDLARRSLRRLLSVLGPWVDAGVPVVVPEPSSLVAFRDELPALLPGDPNAKALAGLARSPAEHLVAEGHLEELRRRAPLPGAARRALLHPHCHQRSVVGTAADVEVLEALGYEVEVLDAGCCGLAGSFGFNARHEPLSRRIGNEIWLPRLRQGLGAAGGHEVQLVMDGFSCRTQLSHLADELVDRAASIPALVQARLVGR